MEEDKTGDQSRVGLAAAKKLYGTIQELGTQIYSLSSRCLEIEDLFAHDLQAKRLSLKDCCESLFNLSPKAYGAVAREKLWRLALYDAVNRARRLQKDRQWTPVQLDLVKTHLQGGIGVLQLYIMKLKGLCESPNDPVVTRNDFIDGWLERETRSESNAIIHGNRERTWITDLVHLCIINIGDMYRYLKEMHAKATDEDVLLETSFYFSGAQTHYTKAFLLRPDSGLAFNQLGNLCCDINGSLQSAYYLLYSVQSVDAYEGAFTNLRQLLDRKIVQFARLPASVESKPVDTLVNSILSLMYHFLYEHSHLQNYERHCQEALTNFHERLATFDPEMDEKFLFHLSSICVMIVWRLQLNNSVHTSSAVAFAISVFCQLMNHLTGILEQHARVVQQLSIPASPYPLTSDADQDQASDVQSVKNDANEESSDQEDVAIEKEEKKGFVIPKRRKCIRRVRNESDSEFSDLEAPDFLYSDEEVEDSDDSEEDNWSDDDSDNMSQKDEEESSDGNLKYASGKAFDSSSSNGSNGNSENGGSEEGEKGALSGNGNVVDSGDGSGQIEFSDSGIQSQKFVLEKDDFLKCRSQVEATLVALSPFLRWIQASPVIKDALAANAEKAFLEKICSVMNLLLSRKWAEELEEVTQNQLKDDWKILTGGNVNEKKIFQWELEEDRSMLGIPQMHDFMKELKLEPISTSDALVIRIGRMIEFGSWLVSTESYSILYNSEDTKFYVPTPQTLKAYLLESKLKRLRDRFRDDKCTEVDRLSKAYKEMKIRSLEKGGRQRRNRADRDERGRRRRGGYRRRRDPASKDPTYAVVDLEAVLKRFKDVKRIAANKKFIVVIPNSVWKTLDTLKDSENDENCENARTTFRWLEAAFGRKHPGFVLYKDQQKLKINFPYPKDPVDLDAWEYYEMMEYCNYIMASVTRSSQSKPRSNEVVWGDVRDKCPVFFLTGHESIVNTRISRSFDPVKIARNVGIFVDYVALYPGIRRGRNWKSVAKSNG